MQKTVLANCRNKDAIKYWSVELNVKRQNSLINLTNENIRSLWRSGVIETRDMAEYARAKQIIRQKNKVVNLSLFAI